MELQTSSDFHGALCEACSGLMLVYVFNLSGMLEAESS